MKSWLKKKHPNGLGSKQTKKIIEIKIRRRKKNLYRRCDFSKKKKGER